jgi:hypothetical protein
MKKTHIAVVCGVAMLGILALVTVARGSGSGVTAAEDERFRVYGTTLTRYLGSDTFLSIPSTFTTIGEEAFSGNDTLTSVEIPSSVTEISYNAFKNCTSLTSIIIPDTVTKIGPGAFEGCTSLASVEIGKGVSSWGTGVFTNCDSLAKVTIDSDNEYLTYYNGAIYNGNMTMLYQVLPNRDGENYLMPNTVTDIDAYAFWNMKNLKNVMVSENVTDIPKYSFSYMGTVENVIIQNTTTKISEKAFANNSNLKQVAIPASVTSIDKKAFDGTSGFKIYTSKSSAADTFGTKNNIEVIYTAEYTTDFMDSNTELSDKPVVGVDSTEYNGSSTGTKTENGTQTEGSDVVSTDEDGSEENASGENTTEEASTEDVSSKYVHPLDVPEGAEVVGKTVIVGGRAVILSNNHDEKVYGE